MTFDLLIVFTDGLSKTIPDVANYRYTDDLFIFEKNRYQSFLPKENIKYFGLKDDWSDN